MAKKGMLHYWDSALVASDAGNVWRSQGLCRRKSGRGLTAVINIVDCPECLKRLDAKGVIRNEACGWCGKAVPNNTLKHTPLERAYRMPWKPMGRICPNCYLANFPAYQVDRLSGERLGQYLTSQEEYTVKQMEGVAEQLHRLADDVARHVRKDRPIEKQAKEIMHTVAWGVANMNLDGMVGNAIRVAEARAVMDTLTGGEAIIPGW